MCYINKILNKAQNKKVDISYADAADPHPDSKSLKIVKKL